MASNAPNKSLAARASAVLTTGEVAATRIDLNECWGGIVTVQADFTIGMLTNVILKFYASMDGTNYYAIQANVAAAAAEVATLTASGTPVFAMPSLAGWKFFRVTAQGTGTVTNSLLALTYRYLRRGSQG